MHKFKPGAIARGYFLESVSEQAVIAEIRNRRAERWTLERIAADLTRRAVPTKTGKSSNWTHQAVARILKRGYCALADLQGATT